MGKEFHGNCRGWFFGGWDLKEETTDATFPRKHGTYWSKRIAL